MHLSIILLVFGVIFIAELPDKSMFASLALSSRYRKSYVWLGAATAFLLHVIIAVTAGHFLTLIPKRILDFIIGGLFLLGALLLFFGKDEDASEEQAKLDSEGRLGKAPASFWKAYGTSFGVVFLGEWGDITQIATANYAAKYHDVVSVAIGAILGLWTVSALGIVVGQKLLSKIPARTVQMATGALLLMFAIFTLIKAIRY
jgi:putative Ca2+/H+ antiporter (TMEM165/GDT1 family)